MKREEKSLTYMHTSKTQNKKIKASASKKEKIRRPKQPNQTKKLLEKQGKKRQKYLDIFSFFDRVNSFPKMTIR